MNPVLLDKIISLLDAIPEGHPLPGNTPIRAVCTDTRQMKPDSLFICLKGDNHDSHEYLAKAAEGGAIAALVDQMIPLPPAGMAILRVADTRRSMGKLAAHVRRDFLGKVIAIGGSNGKTTTKHLVASALASQKRGSFSPKSFNNDIGVPLAIFPAKAADDYLVLELGTNHPGELAPLSRIAQPDIAVITSIGAEHLEGFGDMAGVVAEEASILEGLLCNGLLLVNGDYPELLAAVAGWKGRKITFGLKEGNDLRATDIVCTDKGVLFRVNGQEPDIFVPMLGRHSASNALVAVAIAQELQIEERYWLSALSLAIGPEMRMQKLALGPVTVINDAYNANPTSMEAGLQTMRDLPAAGRRVAVLGDMKELGPASDDLHRQVGDVAAKIGLDLLITIGKSAQLIGETVLASGMPKNRVMHFDSAMAAADPVAQLLAAGDLVLLKGSRSMRLESIVNRIAVVHAPAASTQPA